MPSEAPVGEFGLVTADEALCPAGPPSLDLRQRLLGLPVSVEVAPPATYPPDLLQSAREAGTAARLLCP